MSEKTLKTRIRHAYKTESEWTSTNPILKSGEVGYVSDTNHPNYGRYKVGDGTKHWNELNYADKGIYDKVNNIEIGGRNLWENGDFSKDLPVGNISVEGSYEIVELDAGNVTGFGKALHLNSTYSRVICTRFSAAGEELIGKILTMQCWIKYSDVVLGSAPWNQLNVGKYSLVYELEDGTKTSTNYGSILPSFSGTSDGWVKLIGSVTFRSDAVNASLGSLWIGLENASSGEAWVTGIKLEYGNKATDWTPAPEDKADTVHTHSASDITSGTLSSSRLPTVPVSKGGTGLTTITSGQVLVGNGAGNVTTRAIDTTSGGTSGSTSLITSGAVYSGLDGKANSNHTHSYLPLSGGTLTGDVELPITKSSSDGSLPVSSATMSISDITSLSNYKTYLGSYQHSGVWYNLISTRHRNGSGDGSGYGMYFRSELTISSNLTWGKQCGANWWQAERTILDSSNYNTYTPTKTGTGASGTWGINITGSAGSVEWGNIIGKPSVFTPADHTHISLKSNTDNRSTDTTPNDYNGVLKISGLKNNSTIGISGHGAYSGVLGMRPWAEESGGNSHEFALTQDGEIFHRHGETTSWNSWRQIAFTSSNVASANKLATARTISLTGSVTGSGTFDGSGDLSINTTVSHTHNYAGSTSAGGVANSANKVVDRGTHFETASGTTANSPTTGMLETSGMYMTQTYNDSATPANYGNIINLAGSGTGQLMCEWSGSDNELGHLYYRSHRDTYTGGWSSWGKVAFVTDNVATATKLTTSAGSATQPIYFSDGKPVVCTYSLGKSVPSDAVFTDTHYTTRLKVGASATATANAAASNGSVYINILDNTTIRDSHKITGAGATTVTSDENGVITINSTNTTYTAGSGLTLSGTQFKHSNSVTASTAQGDANKTLAFGGTFTIPTITYDAQGHITGKGTTTMTMPTNPNTWRGIQNNLTSTSTTDSLSANQGKILNETKVGFMKVSASEIAKTTNNPFFGNVEDEDIGIGNGSYYSVINLGSYSYGNYRSQIAMPYQNDITDSDMYIRTANDLNWRPWRKVIHSGNIGNQSVNYASSAGSVAWNNVSGKPSVFTPADHSHNYLPLSGGTMTGALNFANNIWNAVGDDVAIGDHNTAGSLGVKGLNSTPKISFLDSSGTILSSVGSDTSGEVCSSNNFNIKGTTMKLNNGAASIVYNSTTESIDFVFG